MAAIDVAAASVNRMTRKLTQSQFDAAVSFVFNAGPNTKQKERLEAGDLEGFARALPLYNKGGNGKVLAGLVARRKAELELWNKDKGAAPVTTPTWIALTRKSGDKPKNIFRAMNAANVMSEQVWESREDLVKLLTAVPSAGTAVVTVEDWEPEGELIKPQPADAARLIKTTTRLPGGFYQLLFKVGDKSFTCISGLGYAQNFRRPQDPRSYPGNAEPIPAGRYRIGPVEWKGKPYDWSASWGPGLGACWIALDATFSDDRSAFGIHEDQSQPGSLGCVVFTRSELTELLKVINTVKFLDVDWGL
jgi:hypothetical protein